MYSCLYATHQRNRAILLLVVKEERTVRKPADKVIALVLLDNPVLSHTVIITKTLLLYQFYCINKLPPVPGDPSVSLSQGGGASSSAMPARQDAAPPCACGLRNDAPYLPSFSLSKQIFC